VGIRKKSVEKKMTNEILASPGTRCAVMVLHSKVNGPKCKTKKAGRGREKENYASWLEIGGAEQQGNDKNGEKNEVKGRERWRMS